MKSRKPATPQNKEVEDQLSKLSRSAVRKKVSSVPAKSEEVEERDDITRIYMNHFIKDPNNKEPVITVQHGKSSRLLYVNSVEILDASGNVVARVIFDPEGLKSAPFHHVKAWIETKNRIAIG